MKRHEAGLTVEVVAAILAMMAEAEPNKGSLSSVLLWLAQHLEAAGIALAGEGVA